MNKYLIAYTTYKHYFSVELETATYCVEAENMKEAVKHLKRVADVYKITAISQLDDNITWEDLE